MALSVADVRAALASPDEALRHGAIARLDLEEAGAIGLLVRAMADESWRVRREAVERSTSGGIDSAVLVAALVPMLGEPDDVGLRNAAIEALVIVGRLALPSLHEELASRPAHRKILCDVLGRIAGEGSSAALLPLLRDEDPNVQVAAAEALGRVPAGVDGEASALGEALRGIAAAAPEARAPSRALFGTALLDALARRAGTLPIAIFEQLLAEPVLGALTLRALAVGARLSDPTRARSLIAPLLADPVRSRREAAIRALASVHDEKPFCLPPAALAATTEALLEGTLDVQRAAARLLGASADVSAARPLLVALSDSALTETAERALLGLAGRDPAALLALASSVTPAGHAAIDRVLAGSLRARSGIAPAALRPRLVADLADEDDAIVTAAMDALGALGDPSTASVLADAIDAAQAGIDDGGGALERIAAASRALIELAEHHAAAVLAVLRGRAAPAFVTLLGRVGEPADAAALVARASDPLPAIRGAAIGALAQLVARSTLVDPDHASEAVRLALIDEAPAVRASALGALAAIETRRAGGIGAAAIDGLLRGTRDEDARVRGAAVRALVGLLTGTERPTGERLAVLLGGLRTLADGADALTAVPALEIVLAAGEVADDARLLDALTSVDEERRKVALHALVERPRLLLRGELLRLVERALHDARWDLRRAAVAVLAVVGDIGRAALLGRRAIEDDALVRADLDRALAGGAR